MWTFMCKILPKGQYQRTQNESPKTLLPCTSEKLRLRSKVNNTASV